MHDEKKDLERVSFVHDSPFFSVNVVNIPMDKAVVTYVPIFKEYKVIHIKTRFSLLFNKPLSHIWCFKQTKPNPFLSQTMAIQQQPSYVTKSKNVMEVFNTMYPLLWTLMAFVYVEITGFGDNFVEKNLFVMRLLLVFTVITFLIIIIPSVLENPPIPIVKIVAVIVMPCVSCVSSVLIISKITAIIVFIIWIIVYLIARAAMTIHQEPTTYVSDRERFKFVTDIVFMLFYALILFVGLKITDYRDNLIEKHLFTMFRFSLIVLVITFLIVMIPDLLQNPAVRLLQIMVFMVMSCAVCVLLVALVSTLTAVIVFVVWMVCISIVALQRWTDIVRQMKEVRNVLAN